MFPWAYAGYFAGVYPRRDRAVFSQENQDMILVCAADAAEVLSCRLSAPSQNPTYLLQHEIQELLTQLRDLWPFGLAALHGATVSHYL